MPESAPKGQMSDILAALRAAGEATRLRLLFILSQGEFNVTELMRILCQSQPRISRHLKLMTDAGLLERHKEGSWVVFRAHEEGAAGRLGRTILELLAGDDETLREDAARLAAVKAERAARAAAYFSSVAREWDTIRSLHVAEEQVEQAMLRLAGEGPWRFYADLGTGTGRILELFARHAEHAVGLDLSHEMLTIARARLDAAGLNHAQARRADIYDLPLPDAAADFVTLHQVLHYLDDPAAALSEAARILRPGGRLLIADFAPHDLEFLREEHAHRRLGISQAALSRWLTRAGLAPLRHETLPPPPEHGAHGLTVSLWLAERRKGKNSATPPFTSPPEKTT